MANNFFFRNTKFKKVDDLGWSSFVEGDEGRRVFDMDLLDKFKTEEVEEQ